MSRHNAAPTHSWVIGSQLNKWLALAFIINLLFWIVAIWTVRYSLNRDCKDIYKRDLGLFGYWVHIEAGSNDKGCPAPYNK